MAGCFSNSCFLIATIQLCRSTAGDRLTLVNLDNVLPYDTPRTNVQVTILSCSTCVTKRPDPTSELPIRPSFRPTARP